MAEFRVLGPVEVWAAGEWLPVGTPQQRLVLAVLLADAGRQVPVDTLIARVWDDAPPAGPRSAVHVHVSRLRQVLRRTGQDGQEPARLDRLPGGYVLRLDPERVDLHRFRRLVAAAHRPAGAGADRVGPLRQALALWQGTPLADLSGAWAARARATWQQEFLDAVVAWADAELDSGRPNDVVEPLRQLAAEHPLAEPLAAALMRALAVTGRGAEALQCFAAVRARLADELGTEPGPQLQDVHRAILHCQLGPAGGASPTQPAAANQPPAATGTAATEPAPTGTARRGGRPAQLPADVPGFTGRRAELATLDALVGPVPDQPAGTAGGSGGPPSALVISAVSGTAGVGKTALAVHWAHRVADRFPDGQLYVNLRGYAAGPPVRPIEALAGFLPALGMPAEQVPADVAEAAELYRGLLAGTRTLVVLDNAHDAGQVRPLLPGSPGCLVVVTSRDQLRGLATQDGALGLSLDVLGAAEAEALLVRLLGGERAGPEPAAVAELARLCGYLPLALRIAAANLTARPGTVTDYVARLSAGDRLAELGVDGDPQVGVRSAFDQSYVDLPAAAQRLFRLLGLATGPDIGVAAAAALAGVPTEQAADLLDRLTAAHLAIEHATGRYTLHDLLRHYAAERTASDPDRQPATGRFYAHYLTRTRAANDLLYPHLTRLPAPAATAAGRPGRDGRPAGPSDDASSWPAGEAAGPGFADQAAALAWLDAERANLVAAVVRTAEHGPAEVAWQLAYALRGHLSAGMLTIDWQTVADAALAAAEAAGDPTGQAAAQLTLATLEWVTGDYRKASEHFSVAVDRARAAGWTDGANAALSNLGGLYADTGRLAEAADVYAQSLAASRAAGDRVNEAVDLANLGLIYVRQGRLDAAADHCRQAAELNTRAGSRSAARHALANVGYAEYLLGELDRALDTFDQAVALDREVGDRESEFSALVVVAAIHADAGRYQTALDIADAAVAAAGELGGGQRFEPEAVLVRATVADCRGQHQQSVAGHQRALELARDANMSYQEVDIHARLADAHRRAGNLDQAVEHAGTALTLARRAGYRLLDGNALIARAAIHLHRHEHTTAADLAASALAVHAETGHRLGLARAHLIAGQALRRTDRAAAGRHRQAAAALLSATGIRLADQPLDPATLAGWPSSRATTA